MIIHVCQVVHRKLTLTDSYSLRLSGEGGSADVDGCGPGGVATEDGVEEGESKRGSTGEENQSALLTPVSPFHARNSEEMGKIHTKILLFEKHRSCGI